MTITGKAKNYKTAETLVCRVDNWDPWFVPLALLYRLCQADSACYCRVKVGGGGGGGGGDGGRVSGDWWRAGRVRTAAGGRSVLLQAPP